jgi:hypothetical protein
MVYLLKLLAYHWWMFYYRWAKIPRPYKDPKGFHIAVRRRRHPSWKSKGLSEMTLNEFCRYKRDADRILRQNTLPDPPENVEI